MKFVKQSLDRRLDFVKHTIAAIHAIGVECDRTTRSGEFRLSVKTPYGTVVKYAKSITEAEAIAKQLWRMKE
jgi:hypothetical protein